MVFGKGAVSYTKKVNMKYNPQMTEGKPYKGQSGKQRTDDKGHVLGATVRSPIKQVTLDNDGTRYPRAIQKFSLDSEKFHPTQKPVALLEYLIKTYTDENDWVLDNCMGSGTTGVAAIKTNRNFIGIELDDGYFNIAEERISNTNIK